MPELIDIACKVMVETPKAWRLDCGDKEPVWIPKSQAELYEDTAGAIVTMPHWLAKEKGLI